MEANGHQESTESALWRPHYQLVLELASIASDRGVLLPHKVVNSLHIIQSFSLQDEITSDVVWLDLPARIKSASSAACRLFSPCFEYYAQWATIVLASSYLKPSHLQQAIVAGCSVVRPKSRSSRRHGSVANRGCWAHLGGKPESTILYEPTIDLEDLAEGLACEVSGGGGALHAALLATPSLQLSVSQRLLRRPADGEERSENRKWMARQCEALQKVLPTAAAAEVRAICGSLGTSGQAEAPTTSRPKIPSSPASRGAGEKARKRNERALRIALTSTLRSNGSSSTAGHMQRQGKGLSGAVARAMDRIRLPGLMDTSAAKKGGSERRKGRRGRRRYPKGWGTTNSGGPSGGPNSASGAIMPWRAVQVLANGAVTAVARLLLSAEYYYQYYYQQQKFTEQASSGGAGLEQPASRLPGPRAIQAAADALVMAGASKSGPWCGNAMHLAARLGNSAVVALAATSCSPAVARRAAGERDCVGRTPAEAAAAAREPKLARQLRLLQGVTGGMEGDLMSQGRKSAGSINFEVGKDDWVADGFGPGLRPLLLARRLGLVGVSGGRIRGERVHKARAGREFSGDGPTDDLRRSSSKALGDSSWGDQVQAEIGCDALVVDDPWAHSLGDTATVQGVPLERCKRECHEDSETDICVGCLKQARLARRVVRAVAAGVPVLVRGGLRLGPEVLRDENSEYGRDLASIDASSGGVQSTSPPTNTSTAPNSVFRRVPDPYHLWRALQILDESGARYAVDPVPYGASMRAVVAPPQSYTGGALTGGYHRSSKHGPSGKGPVRMAPTEYVRRYLPYVLRYEGNTTALHATPSAGADASLGGASASGGNSYDGDSTGYDWWDVFIGRAPLQVTTQRQDLPDTLPSPDYMFDHADPKKAQGLVVESTLSRIVPHPLPCLNATLGSSVLDEGTDESLDNDLDGATGLDAVLPFTSAGMSRPQLAIGPTGSGAPPHMHKHAANALLAGLKLWWTAPPSQGLYSTQLASDFFSCSLPCGAGLAAWRRGDLVQGALPFDETAGGHLLRQLCGLCRGGAAAPGPDGPAGNSSAAHLATTVLAHDGVRAVASALAHEDAGSATAPRLCVQRAGDVMVVPHAVSHAVWNLAPSIAVAHEFRSVLGPIG